MNSLWNFLDWILPSVRLSDDLEDTYVLSDDNYSVTSSLVPRARSQYQESTRRNWDRDRDERERARVAEQERERNRQHIQALERENVALYQKVSSLEHELQSARHTIATYTLLSSSIPPTDSMNQPQIYQSPSPDPINLRAAYDSLLSSYTLARRALHERNEEVASLKTFLSKTDEWSGAQLIQALRDLNSEIIQLAASAAEEFSSSLDRRVDLTRQSDRDLVTSALGPVMTNLLATRDHVADPTLVQFAIQAWEVCCVGRVLDAFCFGLPVEVDQFLTSIFERMHRIESQPTTSRWRALTYMHARALLPLPAAAPGVTPSPFQSLNDTSLRGLLAILALSGCTDSRGIHRDPLRARFGGAIARISERAERIATVIKEGVMSCAFEITWVGAKGINRGGGRREKEERWFDWASMDNVYAGHGSDRSKVLCSVEFGLSCVRRVGSRGAPVDAADIEDGDSSTCKINGHSDSGFSTSIRNSTNGIGFDGSLTRSILQKPKVLLESVADIL